MSEYRPKTVTLTAPVRREMLNDTSAVPMLIGRMMVAAQAELLKAFEGRPYLTVNIRFVIGDNGPSFIRGLSDAELEVIALPESD